MTHPVAVRVLERTTTTDLPGRFPLSGLDELNAALGGEAGPEDTAWDRLCHTLRGMTSRELGERLLDEVLVEPPIPAGCEAMVRNMKDPATFPWKTHELLADRQWLWYAHHIVARCLPDDFPAPTLERVRVEITSLEPRARMPGKRATPHDLTSYLGRAMLGRSGDNPLLAHVQTDVEDDEAAWAFDVYWRAAFVDRRRPDADEAVALGATEEAAASGKLLTIVVDAWCDAAWCGDLHAGQTWTARAAMG